MNAVSEGRSLIAGTPYEKTLKELETFFCTAMLGGYADESSSPKIVPHRCISGWKQFECFQGNFHLMDEWGGDTGRTWISIFEGTGAMAAPVWVMHYEGHYEKEVIPFLKSVLATQYARSVFFGGRGPTSMVDRMDSPRLEYSNHAEGSFRHFAFQENIYRLRPYEPKQLIGFHSGWGGMLI